MHTMPWRVVASAAHLDRWLLFLHVPTHTCERSACAHAADKDVNLTPCVLPDLRACSLIVNAGVVGVLKLLQDERVWDGSSNLLCLVQGSFDSCVHIQEAEEGICLASVHGTCKTICSGFISPAPAFLFRPCVAFDHAGTSMLPAACCMGIKGALSE